MIRVAPQLRKYSKRELLGLIERGYAYVEGNTIVPTVTGAAAPPLTNNFEGGTLGNTIATTDTGSGNAWNAITRTTSTLVYDNTQVHTGTLACKIVTLAVSTGEPILKWTGLGSITTELYWRQYCFYPTDPTQGGGNSFRYVSVRANGGAKSGTWKMNSSKFLLLENAAGTTIATGTVPVALNQWIRIEGRIVSSATVGQMDVWLYNTAEAGVESDHVSVTGAVLAANSDELWFGITETSAPTTYTYYLDDLATSTSRIGTTGVPAVSDSVSTFPRPPLGG